MAKEQCTICDKSFPAKEAVECCICDSIVCREHSKHDVCDKCRNQLSNQNNTIMKAILALLFIPMLSFAQPMNTRYSPNKGQTAIIERIQFYVVDSQELLKAVKKGVLSFSQPTPRKALFTHSGGFKHSVDTVDYIKDTIIRNRVYSIILYKRDTVWAIKKSVKLIQ